MSVATLAWLLLAGVGSGLVGYLTGLASLVSYPALLAAGLSPLTANVSNTLGLVGVGVGSTARAWRSVSGDRRMLIIQSIVAALGGLGGALVLLYAGESAFERVVPLLIVAASLAVLAQPWLRRMSGEKEHTVGYLIVLGLISVYGGYFGAGAGTIYLAVTSILTAMSFGRVMVLKSLLLGVTNLVAAITLICFGPVNWWAAIALGIGCIIGGNLGPAVQKLLPERLLRVTVALAGLVLAVWLAVK
ncbi:sulfite exporter TauE/SafE family protein [Naumannella sp. ID2617S]|nr:sulfite exporter TauE/SafE family protein [Naumannella sp. ID2617S]